MRVIALFDWSISSLKELFEIAEDSFKSCQLNNKRYFLTLEEKTYAASSFLNIEQKFQSADCTKSIEIYSGLSNIDDPEEDWSFYLSCTVWKHGPKSLVIAVRKSDINLELVNDFFWKASVLGNLGYGFSFVKVDKGDGRHYAVGVSTEHSSEKEMDEDSRWTEERLGSFNEQPKSRHLSGHFKSVFELNLINKKHLNNLATIVNEKDSSDSLEELPNGNYVWKPNKRAVKRIYKKLNISELLI